MRKSKVITTFDGKRNVFGIIKGQISVIECIVCGKRKSLPNSVILKGHGKYCSRKCYYSILTGSTTNRVSNGYITSKGYVAFSIKGKEVLEHRLVMEKFLGRKFDKYEEIHHKDGDRTNNKIENLELTNKSAHAKIHFPEKLNKLKEGRKQWLKSS